MLSMERFVKTAFIAIALLVTLCVVSGASRRALLFRTTAAGAAGYGMPPTSNAPTLWLDVTNVLLFTDGQSVTNPRCSGTVVTQMFIQPGGDLVYSNSVVAIVEKSGAGALTNNGIWSTNIFSWSSGSIAMRLKVTGYANSGLHQSADTAPYVYIQWFSGGFYFDWGNSGTYRVLKTIPQTFSNAWQNVVFTRGPGTNQAIWIAGTNWLAGVGNSYITNPASGDMFRVFWNKNKNQLVKRVLCWNYGLSTNEVALLDPWMSSLP